MTCPFKEHRIVRGAASAQWIRLRLPSFCPRFESQAYHPRIYQFIFELCSVEKMKINKKRPGLVHLKKELISWRTEVVQQTSIFCSLCIPALTDV